MRILITNDDGINAPGLNVMKRIALTLAGSENKVWTVAPATEQSGMGHCVSFTRPFQISQISHQTFAVEGTPTDCVLAALYDVMPAMIPDLVLPGVNCGNNSGENALYSGTVGAALEASLHGITGIALSQYYGPDNRDLKNPFSAAEEFAVDAVNAILRSSPETDDDYRLFYNVNFPPCAAEDVVGMCTAFQGKRSSGTFRALRADSPTRRTFLWVRAAPQDVAGREGADVTMNLQRYVSITPMRADLTAYADIDNLNKQLACP